MSITSPTPPPKKTRKKSSDAGATQSTNTPHDPVQIAADQWQNFFNALHDVDKIVLDKTAAGYKLKVVCYDHAVAYDTLQKRFKRWQDELGLPGLTALLHVWRTIRSKQISAFKDEPPLMRHAPEVALEAVLRQQPGYNEVALPDVLRNGTITRDTVADESRRVNDANAQLAQCMMSPAVWFATLSIGQDIGIPALQRSDVPLQHHVFLAMLDAVQINTTQNTDDIEHITQWLQHIDADRFAGMGRYGSGGQQGLPLAITARKLGLFSDASEIAFVALCQSEIEVRQMAAAQLRSHWQSYAERLKHAAFSTHNDLAFWQRFCVYMGDAEKLRALVRTITLDLILAPLTGMIVAMLATGKRFAVMHTEMYPVFQVFLLARRRHAQSLGIHPSRVLAYFAMEQSAVAAYHSMVLLAPAEVLTVDAASAAMMRKLERTSRKPPAVKEEGTFSLDALFANS